MKTGGGTFNPQLRAVDELMLGMMEKQVHPMENVFDDAAFYFGKNSHFYANSKKHDRVTWYLLFVLNRI